jgi:hypothetical protein
MNSYSGSIRPVLRIRIHDPELFDPWMRILDGKTIRIWVKHTVPVHISESIENFFWIKIPEFFYEDPEPEPYDSGSGMENFGSGIRYKHPGIATLYSTTENKCPI